jgi:hypothetical protein
MYVLEVMYVLEMMRALSKNACLDTARDSVLQNAENIALPIVIDLTSDSPAVASIDALAADHVDSIIAIPITSTVAINVATPGIDVPTLRLSPFAPRTFQAAFKATRLQVHLCSSRSCT